MLIAYSGYYSYQAFFLHISFSAKYQYNKLQKYICYCYCIFIDIVQRVSFTEDSIIAMIEIIREIILMRNILYILKFVI
jgi:hypothetical protein